MKKLFKILCTLLILTSVSCKKNSSISSSNIIYGSLNQTISAVPVSGGFFGTGEIVMTGDIDEDLDLEVELDTTGSDKFSQLQFSCSINDEIAYNGTDLIIYKKAKVFAGDQEITSASTWSSGVARAYNNSMALGVTNDAIIPGSGDKYVGVRLKLSDNTTHYGWIRINYAANGFTVVVKDFAYNKNANESIKAGQK